MFKVVCVHTMCIASNDGKAALSGSELLIYFSVPDIKSGGKMQHTSKMASEAIYQLFISSAKRICSNASMLLCCHSRQSATAHWSAAQEIVAPSLLQCVCGTAMNTSNRAGNKTLQKRRATDTQRKWLKVWLTALQRLCKVK
jgi:hypothetical protein